MAYMSDEEILKKNFVEYELEDMLRRATGGCVPRLEYSAEGCEEFVAVRWQGDPLDDGSCVRVNVTGDSRWAIAKDVMAAVARLYE